MSKRYVSPTRRCLLCSFVVAGAVMVSPKWAVSAVLAPRLPLPDQRYLLWALAVELGGVDSIGVFADNFISRFPNRSDIDTLTQSLLTQVRSVDVNARMDTTRQMRAGLARLVRADFHAGRIEVVEGWQLSLTELYLCVINKLMTAEQMSMALAIGSDE